MQSIWDIIDSTLTTGFSYFYGLGDDQGYLRRMLMGSPSLEAIYARLRDDIEFISKADEDYFQFLDQLKAFKKLKKHLIEAKKYIKTQIEKKKKGSKWETAQVNKEIRALDKDLRAGMIEEEDYNYSLKMLLRPTADNLEEVKTKFEEIDGKVKKETKEYGFEEENLEFDEEGEELSPYNEFAKVYDRPIGNNSVYDENYTPNINKLVDEDNRRYTMDEYNDIYEDMKIKEGAQQPANAKIQAQQTIKKDTDLQKFLNIKDNAIKRHVTKPLTPQEIKNLQNIAAQTQSRMKSQMSPADFQQYLNSGIFNLEL